jgi:hypothetical protein
MNARESPDAAAAARKPRNIARIPLTFVFAESAEQFNCFEAKNPHRTIGITLG